MSKRIFLKLKKCMRILPNTSNFISRKLKNNLIFLKQFFRSAFKKCGSGSHINKNADSAPTSMPEKF